ncbi:hypothetical protein BN1708_011529 [Verticillium longisporum]|uniref:Initiator tRNA phosphoribosyl transferase n=1 Tax=Verticillium longisporum TaxID=100787 RepID=A0A0G4L145_VERLO|nr:hypothetical protein BN1708_011529 [Verticillium longisporum]
MTSLSDIVFPSASEQPNFSHLLTELKRGDLSISNRLRSIIHDADFVREVAAAFGSVEEGPTEATGTVTLSRPLVANERCGSWYIPPSTKSASAYFKSTDGHDNAWKFSTRRLNLHLLEIIGRCDGCIIVDSTRRGKRIPDALSKTIPIWCAVLNRALFPSLPEEAHALHTPPNGAGDDTENWACGLTAELFWAHVDQLLGTPEGELPALVRGLVDACEPSRGAGAKKVAPSVAVCALAGVEDGEGRRCTVKLTPAVTEKETWIVKAPTEMEVGVGKHKVGSRNLRAALPDICGFVTRFHESQKKEDGSLAEGTTVLVACETGKDLSVAVALAICLWCFDQQDNYRAPDTKTIFNKDMVRNRLGSIMTAYPEANPGRASLQSVNSFLMDYRR